MDRRHIAILVHEVDSEQGLRNYAIGTMMEFWREAGHRVSVVAGTRRREPADLVIVHVDLSVVPAEYLEFARGYPIAVNAGVADIRRRAFADNLVAADDPWDGPVIVKSDLNHGGLPEQRIASLSAGVQPKLRSPVYRIFERLDAVPRQVFDRPDLVVQKFHPEREEDCHHVRNLHFMGDHVACRRRRARGPLVDGDHAHPESEIVDPHPEMLATRARLGFDYGKFDYTVIDGRAHLIDINKTIGNSTRARTEAVIRQRQERARGLYAYFRGLRPFPLPAARS